MLELLELPSLMREALNAEDYESALDIFAFIRNLCKRYSEIPVVQVFIVTILHLTVRNIVSNILKLDENVVLSVKYTFFMKFMSP